jgi:hypothetical protein
MHIPRLPGHKGGKIVEKINAQPIMPLTHMEQLSETGQWMATTNGVYIGPELNISQTMVGRHVDTV